MQSTNSKLSLNRTSSSSTQTLSRFKQRALDQAKAQEQASKEYKVTASPWTSGSLPSQERERRERDGGERRERRERGFGERRERGFGERRERGFGERRERGFGERRERGFGERRERGFGERRERGFGERRDRFNNKPRANYVEDSDFPAERAEREVIDARSIFDCEVPIGRMVELPVCEMTEKGAFVNAQEHGALFVPNSQLPEGIEVGQNLRVFLYKDGERVLATARRPYIELGMTGNLRINSVENGTAYLELGIPKELVVPVSEQRFRFYPGDYALVLVSIDKFGRIFGTQCFNRYIRDKAAPHEFETNQKVKVVAVAKTPLGFRVIVDDKVYGLIYEAEQKGELLIGKRYEGFVKAVRPDGRLDISLQESGIEGIEHASLDILQALYFSDGVLNFNDKSDPKDIEMYMKMSKSRFKKALGALYSQRLVEITEDGVKITKTGMEQAQERFANIKKKDADSASDVESELDDAMGSSEQVFEDIDALADGDMGSDDDDMADEVVKAVAQVRRQKSAQDHEQQNKSTLSMAVAEATSWGENLDELGDFAGRRSAVAGEPGSKRFERSERSERGERGHRSERRERFEHGERPFNKGRSFDKGGRFDRRERSFGERSERPFKGGERPFKDGGFKGKRSEERRGDFKRSEGRRFEGGKSFGSKGFRGKR